MTIAVIILILMLWGLAYSIYIVKFKKNPTYGETETASGILSGIITLFIVVIAIILYKILSTF